MSECYLTCLSTDDYLPGVLILKQSLVESGTKHDLVCLTNNNLSKETFNCLDANGIGVEVRSGAFKIHSELYKNNIERLGEWSSRFQNTFLKLYAFGVPYDKVVFLDADCVVFQNIDELFNHPHLSAVLDSEVMFGDSVPGINSGLMVIEPNKDDFLEKALGLVETISVGGDQDLINKLYPSFGDGYVKTLPVDYNVFFTRWLFDKLMKWHNELHFQIKVGHLTDKFWMHEYNSKWLYGVERKLMHLHRVPLIANTLLRYLSFDRAVRKNNPALPFPAVIDFKG